MGLDYGKAKRKQAARRGEPVAPQVWNTDGWRTEYPEDFPVTVRPVGDMPKLPRQSGHKHRNRRKKGNR